MKTTLFLFAFAALLAAAVSAAPERRVVNGISYHVIRAAPAAVLVVWKDGKGDQLRTFPAAAHLPLPDGVTVEAVMNGGIFEPGGIPSGLLVQEGRELHPVNRADGLGNFFLKPNGILLLGESRAAIIPTEEYPPSGFSVRFAVQSGPLLLRGGLVNPQLSAESTSRLVRNGVGIAKSGEVVLAISTADSPRQPNLHEFASLFLALGCGDALFLDGVISHLRTADAPAQPGGTYGSFIVVTKTTR